MNTKLKQLILTAMLIAVILLLGLTPIGIISIPPANATIMHIPVIIGTLILGWKAGLVLGAAFGAMSVYKLFTATSALMAPLLGINPVIPVGISVVARLFIPLTAYLVSRCFKRHEKLGIGVSAAAGTLANTVFYLGLMLIAYVACGLDSTTLLGIITGVAGLNGGLEMLIAVLVCTPIVIAVRSAQNKKTVR